MSAFKSHSFHYGLQISNILVFDSGSCFSSPSLHISYKWTVREEELLSHTHNSTSHPPGALPVPGQDGSCPMKVHQVPHLPPILNLPQWFSDNRGCPFCHWVLALGQPLQLGALIGLIPSWMSTSPMWLRARGHSFTPQLRNIPGPSLVQCHHICI